MSDPRPTSDANKDPQSPSNNFCNSAKTVKPETKQVSKRLSTDRKTRKTEKVEAVPKPQAFNGKTRQRGAALQPEIDTLKNEVEVNQTPLSPQNLKLSECQNDDVSVKEGKEEVSEIVNTEAQELFDQNQYMAVQETFPQQALKTSLQRKREAKGTYKAKFSLEKLIVEYERKQILLVTLRAKQSQQASLLNELRIQAGKKTAAVEDEVNAASKTHHDFLIKEMLWMQEDFERERKNKTNDAKKQVRLVRKELQERELRRLKQVKEAKVELRRKANAMAKMVGVYWKSVEKIVKHNYSVQFEKKRQQQRAKKLENFVSKHLKLSVKVAEELNTKSFVDQSKYVNTAEGQQDVPMPEQTVRLYGEKDTFDKDDKMTDLAEQTVKMAELFKPTGTTLESAQIATAVPFLLQNSLREYQIIGLDWLITLHNKRLNGILADEMGLGKTIQTIAMLASLACDKGIWGPHLIIVPTTIIINWEMEFKRWCPAFKILTYFGSQKERKIKRQGWSKANSFHVCITSYKLVIQDHFAFRRKKWYYMVLDEAQNIKNFKSQRWQTLLRFNTKRRLLLTGTPLQNDVMELWSLMHFLMPQIFSNQQDFKEWFSNPLSQSINQNQSLNIGVVQKLQSILRPFLLRRMKRDVEKQLPEKVEHIVQCNLSRRQRLLYDEYINNDKTQHTLGESDFFSIMNVLMQLRKVCNHPDLFESRSIESPFIFTDQFKFPFASLLFTHRSQDYLEKVSFQNLNLVLPAFEHMSRLESDMLVELMPARPLIQALGEFREFGPHSYSKAPHMSQQRPSSGVFDSGLAETYKYASNCNVLAESNTQNLRLSVPKILATQVSAHSICTNQEDHEFAHQHPSYLNVACVPFAQQCYSLDSFDRLRYPQSDETNESTYVSALSNAEKRQKLIALGHKLVTFAHYDKVNRLRIMTSRPVYGCDLRAAVKVTLLLSADILDGNKKFNYVDRYTWESSKESSFVPSAVFNSFACKILEEDGIQYEKPGCRSYDFPYMTEEEVTEFNLQNSLVQELTESQMLVNKQLLARRVEELKRREEETTKRMKAELKEMQARAAQIELQVRQEEEAIEVVEEAEPGELGVVLEIDLKDIDREDVDRVRCYSLITTKRAPEEPVALAPEENAPEQDVASLPVEDGYCSDVDMKEEVFSPKSERSEKSVKSVYIDDFVEIEAKSEHSEKSDLGMEEPREPEQLQKSDSPRLLESNFFLGLRNTEALRDMIVTPLQRNALLEDQIRSFKFLIPKVVAKPPKFYPTKVDTTFEKTSAFERFAYQKLMSRRNVHQSLKFSNILFFPHKNLIQYDCGKLQRLAQLLKTLYMKGSKVLIFTQMTRMLDILEAFLNLHGYSYCRLDGSVKVEARQKMVDKFNLSPKIFCFISSTRCGGIGINLTGADCVIFYDTDWNPAMDKQAQDRSHRIGQTKTVHIYRLISVNTVEENIFRKSLQKREIGGLIIEGNFDVEFFKKVNMRDLLDGTESLLKVKRRNIFEEENIIFHHQTDHAGSIRAQDDEHDLQKQAELETYKRKFEEAMIRIEDEEDIEAYKEAKAEIDDEFEEKDDLPTAEPKTEAAPEEEVPVEAAAVVEPERKSEKQEALDRRNAAGVSRDLKKSELIDWENHPTLNQVTKMAIQSFEQHFKYEDFLEERIQLDLKSGKTAVTQNEDEEKSGSEDSETTEEAMVFDWDRARAEQVYSETRVDLQNRYF